MKYNKYRNEEILLKENEEAFKNSALYGYGTVQPKNSTPQPAFPKLQKHYYVNSRNGRSSDIRYDRKSMSQRPKPSWFIELDRDLFYKQIKDHLKKLSNENDKIEDKDKPTMLRDADVWNYPNALLYSATVITTIG